ncbi:MAG: transcriptional regulator NrdR [Elusimicrobiota bacterium]|jgi:transcriptional repressor NrdR|nr:transcriptional regulator NrdR [Elusimicrobiota bacterium]
MKCPFCDSIDSIVIDSRPVDNYSEVRRRRACEKCGKRYTTYERIELVPIVVLKKDNTKESFDRDKVKKGILTACRKRPVPLEEIEKIVNSIEYELQENLNEVPSQVIGNKIMEKLKKIDEIAYIRFVSVYKDFENLDNFIHEITKFKV